MIFPNVPLELKYCGLVDGVLTLSFLEYGQIVDLKDNFHTVADLYDQIVEYPQDFMDLYNTHRTQADLPLYDQLQFLSFLDGDLKVIEIIARASEIDEKLVEWKKKNPENIRKELAHDRLLKENNWLIESKE